MMASVDINSTADFRKKHTLSPNVLLLTLPDNSSSKNKQYPTSCSIELPVSQYQEKHRTTSRFVDLRGVDTTIHDSSLLSYAWQRQSNRVEQLTPAPDLAYRFTYLEKPIRKKSAPLYGTAHGRLSSPQLSSARSQHSEEQQSSRLTTARSSYYTISDSSQRNYPQQYRSIYDYIRHSLKKIERERNSKQEKFATRIKRPQNDDAVLQRVLSAKRYSLTPTKMISIAQDDFRDTQNVINYIHHPHRQVRTSRTTTPSKKLRQ